MLIRDIRHQDLAKILSLNNAASPGILPLEWQDMEWFFGHAEYFRVAVVDGHVAGFLIALREGHDYASENYRWIAAHEPRFVYIDRIVLAPQHRGLGLGRAFYCDVESFAEVRVPRLTCEVFLEPRNDVAVLFHGTYGFNEVGQHRVRSDQIRTSLLAKDLPSFAWVEQRYLAGDGLPDLPWLRDRIPARRDTPSKPTGQAA